MAVSEKKVTGKFYRIWSTADKLWHRISFWTHANDVEFNDGKTAQTKVGAIKGITTSTNTHETGYAADATTITTLNQSVTTLNQSVTELNQSLGNLKLNGLGNLKLNGLSSLKIDAGTVVKEVKSGNNSFVLFNFQQVKDIFDSQDLVATDIVILVSNGDGRAFPSHLEGVTFLNDSWHVVFKDTLQGDMNCRVQYVMFYCKY